MSSYCKRFSYIRSSIKICLLISVLFDYKNFFKLNFKLDDYLSPFLFAIICQLIGFVLHFWSTNLFQSQNDILFLFALFILFSPIFIMFSIFLNAFFLRIGAKYLFQNDLTYNELIKLISYSSAPYVFSIGGFGNLIAIVWSVIIQFNGLKELTSLSRVKILLIIFFPIILLFVILLIYASFLSIP